MTVPDYQLSLPEKSARVFGAASAVDVVTVHGHERSGTHRVWWASTPKSDGREKPNEDALRVEVGGATTRFAVADGATESLEAGLWAAMLVGELVGDLAGPGSALQLETFARIAGQWREQAVGDVEALSWNVRAKAEAGAAAAVVWGRIVTQPDGTSHLHAAAVGDSCVLVYDTAGTLAGSHPISDPDEFGSTPALLRTDNFQRLSPQLWDLALPAGAHVVVATDAVAQWMMRSSDNAGELLRAVRDSAETFRALIVAARRRGMVNDDAAAVVVQIP